jgi:hypothetical protein
VAHFGSQTEAKNLGQDSRENEVNSTRPGRRIEGWDRGKEGQGLGGNHRITGFAKI